MRHRLIARSLLLSALTVSLQAAVALPSDKPAATPTDKPAATPTDKPADKAAALSADVDGPAKAAIEAFQAGDFGKAVELAQPLAAQGNAEALNLLGMAYQNGQGVEVSKEKALEYFRKAVAGKSKGAIQNLATILLSSGKEEDRDQACKMLDAAAKDDPAVAVVVGRLYLEGKLSPKPDVEKAIGCWKAAAAAENVTAMKLLASFYEGRFGFPDSKDPKQAIDFLNLAAKTSDKEAMVVLGERLLNGDEKIRDEKKGREWLKKAIEAKEYSAYLVLGEYEETAKKDPKAAFSAYDRGRDAGQVECMLRTAICYIEGKGVDKDADRGDSLLKSAAEKGSPGANFRLAKQLITGEKLEKADLPAYYGHLIAAASGNLAEAQCELGMLYLNGGLGAMDVKSGLTWLQSAVQGGNPQAQYLFGILCEKGEVVPKNLNNAFQLYVSAANQNHGPATLAAARLLNGVTTDKSAPIKAWAFASLAVERGEKDAEKLVKEISGKLDEKQRTEAAKQLEDMKSGKAPKKDEPKKDPVKKDPPKATTTKPADKPKIK